MLYDLGLWSKPESTAAPLVRWREQRLGMTDHKLFQLLRILRPLARVINTYSPLRK